MITLSLIITFLHSSVPRGLSPFILRSNAIWLFNEEKPATESEHLTGTACQCRSVATADTTRTRSLTPDASPFWHADRITTPQRVLPLVLIHNRTTLWGRRSDRLSHELMRSLPTAARSRRNFTTVPRAAHKLFLRECVSGRFATFTQRRFGVAHRVLEQCETTSNFPPCYAQLRRITIRFSSTLLTMRHPRSRNPYTDSRRFVAQRKCFRDHASFQNLFWDACTRGPSKVQKCESDASGPTPE